MKARIVFDCDGTDELTVEAERISSQLWSSGKAMVRLRDSAGRVLRSLQFSHVYLIDTDRGGGDP